MDTYRHHGEAVLLQLVGRDGPGDVDTGPKGVEGVSPEAVTGVVGGHPYGVEAPPDLDVFVASAGCTLVLRRQETK